VGKADRPWTPQRFARHLRVTHHKILQWIHSGELPATNIATRQRGRPRYRISADDLARFSQERASLTIPCVGPERAKRPFGAAPFPKTRHSQT
jgi:excisionase family DNA binding protein